MLTARGSSRHVSGRARRRSASTPDAAEQVGHRQAGRAGADDEHGRLASSCSTLPSATPVLDPRRPARSPRDTGPPARGRPAARAGSRRRPGVPVRITSPGSSAVNSETRAMIVGTSKIIAAVLACCMRSPLRLERDLERAGVADLVGGHQLRAERGRARPRPCPAATGAAVLEVAHRHVVGDRVAGDVVERRLRRAARGARAADRRSPARPRSRPARTRVAATMASYGPMRASANLANSTGYSGRSRLVSSTWAR